MKHDQRKKAHGNAKQESPIDFVLSEKEEECLRLLYLNEYDKLEKVATAQNILCLHRLGLADVNTLEVTEFGVAYMQDDVRKMKDIQRDFYQKFVDAIKEAQNG